MRSVKTDAGIVVIDNLQAAKKRNLHSTVWVVELYYSNKKEAINLECKSEEVATRSLDQISEALNEKPTTGTVRFTR